MPIGLKDSMKMARAAKEQEILDVLINRKDLSYETIGKMFGVSEWPIKQIVKKYNLKRPTGPKKPTTAVTPASTEAATR
jgi:transposase